MLFHLRKPAVVLAALLQVLPLARMLVTNPATASTFAIILRWGIGAGAVVGSVDAVSGATSVFTTPSTFSGAVGTVFSNNVTVSIGGGNQAASSDYFIVSSGAASSPALGNKQSTSIAMPPGLTFTASWVNNANTIGGIIYGTPTTAGSYPATVTCVSPGNAQLSQNITITITGSSAPTAPAITGQPAATNVVAGKNATFTVTAGGTAPLRFFWSKNGTPLADGGNVSGSATATLTLPGVSTNDAANYSVIVTNIAGSITSSAALLTVLVPPTIISPPTNVSVVAGNSASFTVTANGTAPLSYQWLKNGVAISGATSATLTLATVTTADAASYSVSIGNSAGSVTSGNAVLIVQLPPSIVTQPANQFGAFGSPVTLSVTAAGTGPLAYQWFKAGVALADGANISGSATSTLTITALTTNETANYFVVVSNAFGSVTSASATISVNATPVITGQPASQYVAVGSNAVLNVTASGSGPFTYQWLKNGVKIKNSKTVLGATSNSLTLLNVTTKASSTYTVVVKNTYGSATSTAAKLSVLTPPKITSALRLMFSPRFAVSQPGGQARAGTNITLTVTATGSPPLAYQWFKNGVALANAGNISGSTTNVLKIAALTTNDTANYSVVVSNPVGSVTNSTELTVFMPPVIVIQPASQQAVVSNSVTFSTTVSGTAPLHCQWRKFAKNIIGATNFTFTIPSASTNDTASYSVVVTNFAGSVTSAVATLTVWAPPVFTLQATNRTERPGATTFFSALVGGTAPFTFQWFKNGVALTDGGNISGSLSNVLTVANLTTNDSGIYALNVSNVAGNVTSSNATLIVRYRSGGGDGGGGSDNVRTKNSLANVVASPPLVIAQIIRNADGSVTLTASGTPGISYILQASPDFNNWSSLSTNTPSTAGLIEFSDPDAATQPARFYRLATP